MELKQLSDERKVILNKIQQYELEGRFDEDVEDDPKAPELKPENVDYLCAKLSNKFIRKIANFIADHYFLNLIKKGVLIIDGMTGEENLEALKKGAVVTCNHFSPFDNYVVYHCIRHALPRKYLYKVIREGNYTNFPGLYGFFFRHCNTLPLSSNTQTMKKFLSAVSTLLNRGEKILIYPEQAMWWNYRKPRPLKSGAFKFATKNGVPVIPAFITMEDTDKIDADGFNIQAHSIWFLPPIYPKAELNNKENAEYMKEENFKAWKELYERVYKTTLQYTTR